MARRTAAEKQAETRARLVDAATRTFGERGYNAASLDEISERAGFSRGAIYSNFAGKEELFLECLGRRGDEQRRAWEALISQAEEFGFELDAFGKVLVQVLPERQWYKALVEFRFAAKSAESRRWLLDRERQWRELVKRLLDVYCLSNSITPVVPLEVIADSLAAVVGGLHHGAVTDPDIDIAHGFTTALELLLAGAQTIQTQRKG